MSGLQDQVSRRGFRGVLNLAEIYLVRRHHSELPYYRSVPTGDDR
jgi:hypothetical protein